MGWTSTLHHGERTLDFINREMGSKTRDGKPVFTVRASGMRGSTWYGAIEYVKDGTTKVFGAAVLTQRKGEEIFWKEIDEGMGPVECHAPAKVLNLLTETTNEDAVAWRAACRANLRKVARSWETGQIVKYGAYAYRLHSPAGARKGWYVNRVGDGALFRMNARQLAQATPQGE